MVCLNGNIIPEEEALLPAGSPGVYYGAGCFETFRSYSGKLLHFDNHIERLQSGLMYLGVAPDNVPKKQRLLDWCVDLLGENNLMDSPAKVRIQAVMKNGEGFSYGQNLDYDLFIACTPYHHSDEPIRICTVSTTVVPGTCRPTGHKLSNMLHYRNAAREADSRGFDDSLMKTIDGSVAETSIGNIFWRVDEFIYTPSRACDILPGIMRNIVANLIEEMPEFQMLQGEFTVDEIFKADEVWVTNSLREIRPVSTLNDQKFSVKSLFYERLMSSLEAYKNEQLK